VRERCGVTRGQQLGSFINAAIHTVRETGVIGMDAYHAEALAAFRTFNYETIYLRGASRHQASVVVSMLRALVEFFAAHPKRIPDGSERTTGTSADALHDAVAYVAGMTDRYACRSAVALLDWPEDQLPKGFER
jgi:dGTPase